MSAGTNLSKARTPEFRRDAVLVQSQSASHVKVNLAEEFELVTDRARGALGARAVLRLTRAVKGDAVFSTLGALCRSAMVVILALPGTNEPEGGLARLVESSNVA